MSFPAYGRYKDSGVEWLGAVPSHWQPMRLKWQLARNDGGAWGSDPDGEDDTIVLRSTEQTVDGRWRLEDPAIRKLDAAERAATLLEQGDLVVTKSSGSALHIGKTTIVDQGVAALGCSYSNFMQRLRVKPSFLPLLAWHIMNNTLAREQFSFFSSSTTGLANLNGSMIGEAWLVVPPLAEQRAIAAFLDRETAKIDALVEAQRRLIELLREKRQAVISHAVTKGLDPSAPMRDSGVEWLGQVPAHWEVLPVRALFRFVKRQNGDELDVLSVYREYGVISKSSRDDNNNVTPEDLSKYQTVHPGDLVINKMKAWQGSLGVSRLQGITSPDYAVFQPIHTGLADYLHLLLRSQLLPDVYRLISNGIRLAQWRLEPEKFKELKVPFPPIAEQQAISAALVQSAAHMDKLATEAEAAIGLLQERRAALISAAVTGKIDVRGLVQSAEAA